MRKSILNAFILIGAAAVGATAMWAWDGAVKNFEQNLVIKQLESGIQQPTVDVHNIGYHGAFADHHAHHHEHEGEGEKDEVVSPEDQKKMADADAKARELFATPGGAYTKADIEKNGTTPPSDRFTRVEFLYSLKAHAGDPIDPILGTKTGGAFDWQISGKTYHFASIASLEEFVIRAKRDPKSILPPDHYVAKETGSRLASR